MDLTPAILAACMPRASAAACATWAGPLDAAAKEFGLTDPDVLAAWLASMANESGQLRKFEEMTYFNTPSERIAFIFGRAPPVDTLNEWKALGQHEFDVRFFDHVYAHLGGYKFRGLGPGQITGRDNCRDIGPVIGVDLLANPEAMRDDPLTGARAFAAYFGPINAIDKTVADGTEASFLRGMRRMNPGLADSEFRAHHLARWREVRAGLGIGKAAA